MRTIQVTLLEDESAAVTPAIVYMGEHNAAKLEVTLPQRLREGFDYYTLCFDQMDCGRRIPLGNIYPGEEGAAYCKNGVIHCLLPGILTHSSYVRVQVEACKQEDGVCTLLEKSAAFTLAFEDSLAGEADTLQSFALDHMSRLMAEIDAAKDSLATQNSAIDGSIVAQLLEIKGLAEQAAAQATAAAADAEASSERLAELEIAAGPGGLPVKNITLVAGSSTATLQPNTRYHISVNNNNATIILDDSGCSAEFQQEFSFTAAVTSAYTSTTAVLKYLSGAEIRPGGIVLNPGKTYECSVLDSLALTADWG